MSTPKWLMSFIVIYIMIIAIHPAVGYAQGEGERDVYCFDSPDSQEVAHCLQDRDLLRQLNEVNQAKISNLEKENELLKKELELKDRVIEIDQKEIDSTRRALADMEKVTDRALKLAESKKSNIWDTYGPIAVILIAVVTIASVL